VLLLLHAAFHPTALPYAYAPGYGLPYAQRISGEANNTCNKNLAMAWAVYTFVKLVPTPQSLIDRMGSVSMRGQLLSCALPVTARVLTGWMSESSGCIGYNLG
jgi:hypothetical protein